MTPYEEAFSPLVDIISARVVAALRKEFRAIEAPVAQTPDRSLTKKEAAEMLCLTETTLMLKVQSGSVPAPYTARGEQPRWSEKMLEKYMSGSWGSAK